VLNELVEFFGFCLTCLFNEEDGEIREELLQLLRALPGNRSELRLSLRVGNIEGVPDIAGLQGHHVLVILRETDEVRPHVLEMYHRIVL
jgi:hypothetical protein